MLSISKHSIFDKMSPNLVFLITFIYRIAHIRQSLGLYEQAVMDYYAALNKLTDHIPSLKGLGETHFLLAKHNARNSTDNKYLQHIEASIKV